MTVPFRLFVSLTLAVFATSLLISPVLADQTTKPKGPIVLTVDGALPAFYLDEQIEFDMAMLRGLGVTTITTSTEQLEDHRTFTGVPIEAVLEAINTPSTTITASALDGYSIDISRQDLVHHGAILAISIDGMSLSTVDKGPLWIMFPFDAMSAADVEAQGPNAVWQLSTLTLN